MKFMLRFRLTWAVLFSASGRGRSPHNSRRTDRERSGESRDAKRRRNERSVNRDRRREETDRARRKSQSRRRSRSSGKAILHIPFMLFSNYYTNVMLCEIWYNKLRNEHSKQTLHTMVFTCYFVNWWYFISNFQGRDVDAPKDRQDSNRQKIASSSTIPFPTQTLLLSFKQVVSWLFPRYLSIFS